MKPSIFRPEPQYFYKLLDYHKVKYSRPNLDPRGTTQLLFDGFDEHNYLVLLDYFFNKMPNGPVIDRTGITPMPYRIRIPRPWSIPEVPIALEDFFKNRIEYLESIADRINILYSGGIDSTSVVVAVLKHGKLEKYRILYNKASIEENPVFFKILQSSDLELVELEETTFPTRTFDGLLVSGGGTDLSVASLDRGFIEKVGYEGLRSPWRPFVEKFNSDPAFLDFCDKFFSRSGRKITTLLEARWWYFNITKICRYAPAGWLQDNPELGFNKLNDGLPTALGFFESSEYDSYTYFNVDNILPDDDYTSYKQDLKQYIFNFDNNQEYFKNKIKQDSVSLLDWRHRGVILKSEEYIVLLDDGERISTDTLPLLTEREYRKKYGDRLNYLFEVQ